MAATIVYDSSEAVDLCSDRCLYLKPIAKLAITVMLPESREASKTVSNWEVIARLKQMAQPHQFNSIRLSRSTMEFLRFEGELETKNLVHTLQAKLHKKTVAIQGFSNGLRVLAVESQVDFPTQEEWESFFGEEKPDTIHLEGLPCKWFTPKEARGERPSEETVREVFGRFGPIRNMDIPMLDMYRQEMSGRNFSSFGLGGLHTFDMYIQFQEHEDFVKAMEALRGMKLMFKGEDGKALACSMKVTFDTTSHLSEAALERRGYERQQLRKLEEQRQQEKLREKEQEEADRRRKEAQREKRRQEKLRKRAQRQRDSEERGLLRSGMPFKAEEDQEEEERMEVDIWEERKLVLALRRLQSIRLLAALLEKAQHLEKLKIKSKVTEPEEDLPQSFPEEHLEEKTTSEKWEHGKANKSHVGQPATVMSGHLSEVLDGDHSTAFDEHTDEGFDYGPIKITINQARDAAPTSKPPSSSSDGMGGCLFDRDYSCIEKPSKRRRKEKIYESEEFLNYLLNHYSYPSYARFYPSPHPASDQASGWDRMVSNNGNSFQISLRNTDGKYCTEVCISQNEGLAGSNREDRYKWKITIKATEPPQRGLGTKGSRLKGYSREFQVQWNESSLHPVEEDLEQSNCNKGLYKKSAVKGSRLNKNERRRESAKDLKCASFPAEPLHPARTSTDLKDDFEEINSASEFTGEEYQWENKYGRVKSRDFKEQSSGPKAKKIIGKAATFGYGSRIEGGSECQGEMAEHDVLQLDDGSFLSSKSLTACDPKKVKKKRKKSKGEGRGSEAGVSKKRKKKRKDKKKECEGSASRSNSENEERRKKHKSVKQDKLQHRHQKIKSEFSSRDKTEKCKRSREQCKSEKWAYQYHKPDYWGNGFGDAYDCSEEFDGCNYYSKKGWQRHNGLEEYVDKTAAQKCDRYAHNQFDQLYQETGTGIKDGYPEKTKLKIETS
ncbi:A-kinase anchor protein 17B-like isoform X1 [Acipenser ruthenus]|uniref:A-kinase anchor protein 17B-like isoform X1 n=1 Tax=Acipenser ruthenus TaxID=7906 RepID=UPI00145B5614|nr:A-kinase anchor protein 17B-like isoform X1 [Acipenser ruthenus]